MRRGDLQDGPRFLQPMQHGRRSAAREQRRVLRQPGQRRDPVPSCFAIPQVGRRPAEPAQAPLDRASPPRIASSLSIALAHGPRSQTEIERSRRCAPSRVLRVEDHLYGGSSPEGRRGLPSASVAGGTSRLVAGWGGFGWWGGRFWGREARVSERACENFHKVGIPATMRLPRARNEHRNGLSGHGSEELEGEASE